MILWTQHTRMTFLSFKVTKSKKESVEVRNLRGDM
jgi:hypothetical protein